MSDSITSKKKHIISHYDPAVLQMISTLKLAEEKGAPAEVIESIKTALELVDQREEFTENVTTEDSDPCKKIIQATLEHDFKGAFEAGKTSWNMVPRMLSGHLEGQFLKSLVSMQNAKRILDIGMFTGYSALSMAEALPADGEIVTLDKEKYLGEFTPTLLQASPHAKKIRINIGDATEYMKQLVKEGKKFDMMFLDADKGQYKEYMKMAFDEGLLVPRGTVLVDNAFQHGNGYIPSKGETVAKEFAEIVRANKSIHSVLVPMRDGVMMLRRVEDVMGAAPQ